MGGGGGRGGGAWSAMTLRSKTSVSYEPSGAALAFTGCHIFAGFSQILTASYVFPRAGILGE